MSSSEQNVEALRDAIRCIQLHCTSHADHRVTLAVLKRLLHEQDENEKLKNEIVILRAMRDACAKDADKQLARFSRLVATAKQFERYAAAPGARRELRDALDALGYLDADRRDEYQSDECEHMRGSSGSCARCEGT